MQAEKFFQQEADELPTRIKLELKTPLENFFSWSSVAGGFLFLMGIIGYFEDGMVPMVKMFLIVGTITTTFFLALYYNTDNYYILDVQNKRLLYHFKFFFVRKIIVQASFSEISSLTVGGHREKSEDEAWWEYRILMINNLGKIIPLSDFQKDSIEKQRQLAQLIARLTGADFVESLPEQIAEASPGINGKFSFSHRSHTTSDSLQYNGLFLVGIIAFTLIMVALIVSSDSILEFFNSLFR